jgi:hypothetical protein
MTDYVKLGYEQAKAKAQSEAAQNEMTAGQIVMAQQLAREWKPKQ